MAVGNRIAKPPSDLVVPPFPLRGVPADLVLARRQAELGQAEHSPIRVLNKTASYPEYGFAGKPDRQLHSRRCQRANLRRSRHSKDCLRGRHCGIQDPIRVLVPAVPIAPRDSKARWLRQRPRAPLARPRGLIRIRGPMMVRASLGRDRRALAYCFPSFAPQAATAAPMVPINTAHHQRPNAFADRKAARAATRRAGKRRETPPWATRRR